MWIDGVDPLDVLEAFVAAAPAMFTPASRRRLQQHATSPIAARPGARRARSTGRAWPIVAVILLAGSPSTC